MKHIYALSSWAKHTLSILFLFAAFIAVAQPANDSCDGASITMLSADGSSFSVSGDATGATDGLTIGIHVWEAFTIAECATVTVSFCDSDNPPSTAIDFVADCPINTAVSGDLSSCDNGEQAVIFENLPAGTYYYPVMADPLFVEGPLYTVTFMAEECGEVETPVNDDICDALLITPGAQLNLDNTDATADGPLGDCFDDGLDFAENDIWLSFTAETEGIHTIETVDIGDNSDTQVAVYTSSDGTCTGMLTEVGCNDDIDIDNDDYMSLVTLTDVVIGETYFIQVDGWDGEEGVFELRLDVDNGNAVAEQASSFFSIYPIPAEDLLYLAGDKRITSIVLLDLVGKVIWSETQLNLNQYQLDLSGIGAGTYLLELESEGSRYVERIVLK